MNIWVHVIDILLWLVRFLLVAIVILPTLIIRSGGIIVAILLLNLDDAQVQHRYLYLVGYLNELLFIG